MTMLTGDLAGMPGVLSLATAGGHALWRASWQGGLALALVWLIAHVWRRLPPQVLVWGWRLAFLKLLLAAGVAGALLLPVLPPPAVRAPAPLVASTPAPLTPVAVPLTKTPHSTLAASPVPTAPRTAPRAGWHRFAQQALEVGIAHDRESYDAHSDEATSTRQPCERG
jgi:hypothetical protein